MFWQIAGLVLTIAQITYYLDLVDEYKDKLEDFANRLDIWADEDRVVYTQLRSYDPEFYEYYRTLPNYRSCTSAIERGKGAAFNQYGENLRRAMRTTRGYSPLTNVHLNNMLATDAIAQSGLSRVVTQIKERSNIDEHILEMWSAIVGAPVGVERYNASAANSIITQNTKGLVTAGRGFNSAGVAFGNQLYGLLNND